MLRQPEVFIQNRNLRLRINPALSLLNNYLSQEIPVRTRCGGKAQCGLCRFRVIEGASSLNPVRPEEIARLGEELIAAGWRLSCQSYALRDLVIELPEAGPAAGRREAREAADTSEAGRMPAENEP